MDDLSVQEWLDLFKNKDVFKYENMLIMRRFLDIGGAATCSQLSKRYGEKFRYYISNCKILAKRIAQEKGIVFEKRDKGSEKRWPILFSGQDVSADDDIEGTFMWCLKPNLKAALEQTDLSDYEPLYNDDADLIENIDELRANIDQFEKLKTQEGFDIEQLNSINRSSTCFLRYEKNGKDCFVNSKIIGYRIHDDVFARRGDYGDGKKTNHRIDEILGKRTPNPLYEEELKQFWRNQNIGEWKYKDYTFWSIDKVKQFFVARITGNQNVFEDSLVHNYWRMQERYDHETDKKNVVTNNLNTVLSVHEGDVLLLMNSGRIYAYGIVKASPKEAIGILSLQNVINNKKHEYFDENGVVKFEDCEAYYERNYNGCISDWSQFIDVEKWMSYCPDNPVDKYGIQSAAGLAVNSIFKVDAEWAKQKIKELNEQFEKNKPEEVKMIERMAKILNLKKNIILQGAPGTGKTYNTAALALAISGKLPPRGSETEKEYHKKVMDEYEKQLIKFDEEGNVAGDGQIGFVTFHQSMDYEDFVEGFKPQKEDKGVFYDIEDGIFKKIRELAFDNYEDSLKSEDEVKSDMDTKTVFERFCAQIETELKEKDCVDLIPSSKLKIRKVFRRADGFAKSISISRTETSPNQTLTLNMILRDYPKFKNGEIKSYEDIKPKYDSNSTYHGNAPYYFELLKQMKFFEEKHNISSKVQKVELKNYILIIDEVNRGNVSKIFGELISLLEADKRVGGDHPLTVILPYSKESFSVPSNLYIIGTMNTTDRSVGSIDYAVRRRFAFVTLEADESKVPEGDARNLFNAVKNFLNKSKYDMDIEDLMVGHSYFMDATNLQMKWQYEILPLLMEYHKDGIISKSPLKDDSDNEIADVKKDFIKFIDAWQEKDSDTPNP